MIMTVAVVIADGIAGYEYSLGSIYLVDTQNIVVVVVCIVIAVAVSAVIYHSLVMVAVVVVVVVGPNIVVRNNILSS